MRAAIDTNVVLDFLLSREPHAVSARQLFGMIQQEKIEAFVTANSITDIYYITAKRLGKYTAREVIKSIVSMLGIISVDGDDCVNALGLPIADFEDALVVICAEKVDLNYIITNDKDFLRTDTLSVKVVGTQDFLDLMQE